MPSTADDTPEFLLPNLPEAATSWGPPSGAIPEQFKDIPYAPFARSDRLSRVADWTAAEVATTRPQRGGGRAAEAATTYGSGMQSAFAYTHAEGGDGEGAFSLVIQSTPVVPSRKVAGTNLGARTGATRAPGQARQMQRLGGGAQSTSTQGQQQYQQQRQGGNRPAAGRAWGAGGGYSQGRTTREPSCKIGSDWRVLEEWEFFRLAKLSHPGLDSTQGKDLVVRGSTAVWDRASMDRATTRSGRPLIATASSVATAPTASHDPVMRQLAQTYPGAIYTTDTVLSLLMCATRTVHPWDIRVRASRKDGSIWLDRRDLEAGRWAVNENAAEVPLDEKEIGQGINTAQALEREAKEVNRRFVALGLMQNTTVRAPDGAAVVESSIPVLHRYRRFVLEGEDDEDEEEQTTYNSHVIVRTELNALTSPAQAIDETAQLLTVLALNEFDPRAPGAGQSLDWRAKLDTQRGAVLANELKNNSLKVGRWCVQSILGGASSMRLGYASRKNFRDPGKGWEILGVQTFKPKELAMQMTLGTGQPKGEGVVLEQGWGVVKAAVGWVRRALEREEEEGAVADNEDIVEFAFVKDPNKPMLRLYRIPAQSSADA